MLAASGLGAPGIGGDVAFDGGGGEIFLPGSISGAVYATLEPLRLRQLSDPGLPGVRLELLDGQGRIVAEAVTDADGQYEFPALPPGVYAVREFQPAGLLSGQQWIGSGGGQSSAVDVISNISLQSGAVLVGYDFAEIPATEIGAVTLPAGVQSLVMSPPAEASPSSSSFRAAAPGSFARPSAPASQPPLAAPAITPLFGGSSQELGRDDAEAGEIERSVTEPDEDSLVDRAGDSADEVVHISRLPAEQVAAPNEARDRAFEAEGEAKLEAAADQNAREVASQSPAGRDHQTKRRAAPPAA